MTNNLGVEADLVRWRHELHTLAETGFEEYETSKYIIRELEKMGLDVSSGIGGTGVVASITVGDSNRVVGLRADMDALNITEADKKEYISLNAGKMHACGHDGHMAMLLGAAQVLACSRDFNGTVRFVFQPAEEHGRGAKAMISDGFLEKFPVDEFYGVHNWPGMPEGTIATRAGELMAAEDRFEIKIIGKGMHAARPDTGIDAFVIASEIILALQTIVSRNLNPSKKAVISCTEMVNDGIRNAIPSCVIIRGDARSFSDDVHTLIKTRMKKISESICEMHGAVCEFNYTQEFIPTINDAECTRYAIEAATKVAGVGKVNNNIEPVMVSEDFGVFLRSTPGCFALIGNGNKDDKIGSVALHSSHYDFNDSILPLGTAYFCSVVKTRLF